MSKKGSRRSSTATAPPKTVDRPREPAAPKAGAQAKPTPKPVHPLKRVLRPLASLQLTVVLLGGCMVLVLWGTLAQVDHGINTVVPNYFRSVVAWVPLRVALCLQVPATEPWITTIPFPGGWAWGSVLMANLLAAHAVRFRLTWRRIGIWTIHIGVITLMLGELITGVKAVESIMVIEEGKASSYLEDHHKFELAFVDFSAPELDKEIRLPDRLLRKGARISDPRLPVDIEVIDYMSNSALLKRRPDPATNPANQGAGLMHQAERRPEVSGVDPKQPVDVPSTYVRFIEKDSGKPLGVWLASPHLEDQRVEFGGKPYELTLRFKRSYVPYTFHLTKFTHDLYPGTNTPKDFRAHVHVIDPETGERNVEIYMNAPLYFRGKTFYQSSFLDPEKGPRGTILAVVENPGWRLPYLACLLVALGMLIHFGIHLVGFLNGPGRARRSKP